MVQIQISDHGSPIGENYREANANEWMANVFCVDNRYRAGEVSMLQNKPYMRETRKRWLSRR